MALGINNIHQDKALSNMSINYDALAGGMVSEAVSQIVNVNNESDKYWSWDRSSTFRMPESLRADGAAGNEITFDATGTNTYSTEEYSYEVGVSDRQKANADSVLQLRKNKMMRALNLLKLGQESRVGTALTTQGNWGAANRTQLTGTTQWNNASFSGSIESDIDTGKEACRQAIGVEPNIIIIPAAVAKVVKRNAEVRELIKYTQNDLLVNGDLPPTMWNMRVFIPGVINVTTQKGASSDTYADVWGKHVVLGYQSGSPLDAPNFYTIFRSADFKVFSFRQEERSREVIRVNVNQDEVFTSSASGYFIEDAIA